MSILRWSVLAIALLISLYLLFMSYMGLLSAPKVTEKEMGPYLFVYDDFKGPYKETPKVFNEVYLKLKSIGVDTTKGLGVYFDDPSTVPEDQLRSQCGSAVEQADAKKIGPYRDRMKVREIKKKNSMVIELPLRNAISYMLGPSKAYPALSAYAQKHGYKQTVPFELYDMKAKKIYYIMEIIK